VEIKMKRRRRKKKEDTFVAFLALL